MNNDAAPSSSARISDRLSPPGIGPNNDTTNDAEADVQDRPRSRQRSRSSNGRQHKRRSKKKQNPGLAKKLGFLTHLLKTLDLVIFAELSSMYYMECVVLFPSLFAIPKWPSLVSFRKNSQTNPTPCDIDVLCLCSSCEPYRNTCISLLKTNPSLYLCRPLIYTSL